MGPAKFSRPRTQTHRNGHEARPKAGEDARCAETNLEEERL